MIHTHYYINYQRLIKNLILAATMLVSVAAQAQYGINKSTVTPSQYVVLTGLLAAVGLPFLQVAKL